MTRQVWLRPKREKEKREKVKEKEKKRRERREKEREKEKQCCDILLIVFFYQNDNFLFLGGKAEWNYRVGLV